MHARRRGGRGDNGCARFRGVEPGYQYHAGRIAGNNTFVLDYSSSIRLEDRPCDAQKDLRLGASMDWRGLVMAVLGELGLSGGREGLGTGSTGAIHDGISARHGG